MNITKNFTAEELIRSATAHRLGIDNTPSETIERNLTRLAENVLEPLREAWGKPIVVSSGYRCPALNKAVGGVSNSQHLLGEAADIHSLSGHPEDNKALFATAICLMHDGKIDVGQLIDEYGFNWIHISLSTAMLHNQILHIN